MWHCEYCYGKINECYMMILIILQAQQLLQKELLLPSLLQLLNQRLCLNTSTHVWRLAGITGTETLMLRLLVWIPAFIIKYDYFVEYCSEHTNDF